MMINDLLDNKNLREEMINRIEVLDKVKKLVMLEGADFMTTDQVAEYYEIPIKTLQSVYLTYQDELSSDGMVKLTRKSLNLEDSGFIKSPVDIAEERTKVTLTDSSGNSIIIPNRGIYIFPKRAILRVGMLLRDSRIAVEVRSQLLNAVEKVDVKTATQDIDKEKELALKITEAALGNDSMGVFTAFAEYNEFKNRHIKKLEDANDSLKSDNFALADGQLTWANRDSMNALVRKLAQFANVNYSSLWNELYKQVNYKYHIDIKARDNYRRPYIAKIRDNEWPLFIKVFAAICEQYKFTFDHIAKNCGFGIKDKEPAFGKRRGA